MRDNTNAVVLALVRAAERRGLTSVEASHALAMHHGITSGALSRLHEAGAVALLTERRGTHRTYVLPGFIDGRATAPHGGTHEPPGEPLDFGDWEGGDGS